MVDEFESQNRENESIAEEITQKVCHIHVLINRVLFHVQCVIPGNLFFMNQEISFENPEQESETLGY